MADDDLATGFSRHELTIPGETVAVSPAAVFDVWLQRFGDVVERCDGIAMSRLFMDKGYWRDILAMTWERRTFTGDQEIASAFEATARRAGMRKVRRAEGRAAPRRVRRSGCWVVEGWFDFDLAVGKGTGFVRLLHNDADSLDAKVWLLLTALYLLRDTVEKTGANRPTGEEYSKIHSSESWLHKFEKAQAFADRDPQVVIVGAGQGGLILAARLRQMGVDVLVVDRIARVGDNWRTRYNNLTIHNEITANHFPYLKFPDTWPLWLPKDMVADWLEAYARFMELNVWTGTEVVESEFDERKKEWSLVLQRADGTRRAMRPKHVVAAMGVSGGMPKKPRLPGIDDFRGTVMHSGEFKSGAPWAGKNAIVVGTGNSGHDIAQDLYVSGAAKVSMLQRGATCVISLDPCARISYGIYSEGIESEDIDLMTAALPYPLLIDSYQHITKRTNEIDKELLAGLERAGFKTHVGADATGFQLCYLRGLGGYYIDVGCSKLIIDGKVPMIQWEDSDGLVAEGLRMKDGRIIPCDLLVLATGFESMQEGIRRMLGDEIADRVGPVWGFDEDYNMRNMWKRTAQDGFWIMGGAILEARLQSRFLALEIKASLEGVLPKREDLPLPRTVRES